MAMQPLRHTGGLRPGPTPHGKTRPSRMAEPHLHPCPLATQGSPGLPILSRSHFLGHKPLSQSAGSLYVGTFLILNLMGAFLTLPELKINLTFLKLHFEGNESIMCTEALASWGETVRKEEVGRVLAPSLPLEYSLCMGRAGGEVWGRKGVPRPPEVAAKCSGSRCCPRLPEGRRAMAGQAGLRPWSENEEVRLGVLRVGLLFFMPELGCSPRLAPKEGPWPGRHTACLKRESAAAASP